MREDRKHTAKQADKTGASSPVIIHNVHILDASGSMNGGKYDNALKGINGEIMSMKTDGEGMTQTIIEFDSDGGIYEGNLRLITHYFMTPAINCTAIKGVGARGGTPLFQTVGETIEKLLSHIKAGDKVLIKIFTDGGENTSQGKYKNTGSNWSPKSEELTRVIKLVEDNHNFTVTFMGTKGDVENMVNHIGLASSNTLFHMNTAESIGATYAVASSATRSYRKEVSRGASQDELKQDFFKRVSKDQDEEKTTN